MPKVLYRVTLTQEERSQLQQRSTRGKHGCQKILNALILLGCDDGAFQECKQTAARLAEVLPISMEKVDGDFEARLVAPSCGKPPHGHARWSLRLLAQKVVELVYVDSIS